MRKSVLWLMAVLLASVVGYGQQWNTVPCRGNIRLVSNVDKNFGSDPRDHSYWFRFANDSSVLTFVHLKVWNVPDVKVDAVDFSIGVDPKSTMGREIRWGTGHAKWDSSNVAIVWDSQTRPSGPALTVVCTQQRK